jgi:membrane protease YdiL (CAAX protease family)
VPLEAFGEEFGWRGYLFPKLMPLGVPVAVLGSGLVWALWHVPSYFIYGNKNVTTFVLFVLYTTFGSTLLCWLRLRARSIWPAAIWHQAYNYQGAALAGLLTPVGMSVASLTQALPTFVLIFEILAFAYLFIWGGIMRAAREDDVVWTSLIRPEQGSSGVSPIAERPE